MRDKAIADPESYGFIVTIRQAQAYSEEQNAARMVTLDEAREFIAQCEWTFAKTMPWCPHWYIVRRNVDNDKFVGFVKLIRAEGEVRPWGRYRHTYFDVDGFQYWTMGAPIGITIIINRSKLGKPVAGELLFRQPQAISANSVVRLFSLRAKSEMLRWYASDARCRKLGVVHGCVRRQQRAD